MLPCHTESTNIDGLQHSVPHKLGSRGTSESRKMLSRYIHFLKTGIESICKAKKSLAFEVLKSVEYHRRWDLAAEICYGSSEADLRKTSQPGSAEVPSRRQKPGARCSSTAATWDSKSSSLESASLTTDRFFSQRLMGSNLSAKFQVKKRKLIRNMKRLPPVSWRSSKTDVSLSLSPDLHFWDAHSFSAYLEELIDWSVSTWSSSVCFLATEDMNDTDSIPDFWSQVASLHLVEERSLKSLGHIPK